MEQILTCSQDALCAFPHWTFIYSLIQRKNLLEWGPQWWLQSTSPDFKLNAVTKTWAENINSNLEADTDISDFLPKQGRCRLLCVSVFVHMLVYVCERRDLCVCVCVFVRICGSVNERESEGMFLSLCVCFSGPK